MDGLISTGCPARRRRQAGVTARVSRRGCSCAAPALAFLARAPPARCTDSACTARTCHDLGPLGLVHKRLGSAGCDGRKNLGAQVVAVLHRGAGRRLEQCRHGGMRSAQGCGREARGADLRGGSRQALMTSLRCHVRAGDNAPRCSRSRVGRCAVREVGGAALQHAPSAFSGLCCLRCRCPRAAIAAAMRALSAPPVQRTAPPPPCAARASRHATPSRRHPAASPNRRRRPAFASASALEAELELPFGDARGAALLLEDVALSVGPADLLSGANLRVEPGECVGLVGCATRCLCILRLLAFWRLRSR